MWQEFLDAAAEWNSLAIIIRLVFSMVVGLLIGIDRGLKRRGAGIKTHSLVCVGSALVMLTSEYIYRSFPDGRVDLARLGAQVICGIGFLGVGTIMVTGKNQVRGLTTAAGLWACACIGLAAGIGFVEGATYCLIIIIFIFKIMSVLDNWIHDKTQMLNFYIEFYKYRDIADFTNALGTENLKITNIDIIKGETNEGIAASISVEVNDDKVRRTLLSNIQSMDVVRYAEEL